MAGVIAIPLTTQQPDLICHRQVPVLCYPLRKEELCRRGERTVRKIANTVTLSMDAVQISDSPYAPHD